MTILCVAVFFVLCALISALVLFWRREHRTDSEELKTLHARYYGPNREKG